MAQNTHNEEAQPVENPPLGLDCSEYREAAQKLVDNIIDYNKTLRNGRPPLPDLKPGFLRERVGKSAPETKEAWQNVFDDIENVVLDGSMHWMSSRNFAYYPCGGSYPSMLGDMLCEATHVTGFSWATSPSCTELETIMMDWLAKALDLPKCFIHDGKGPGGGVIQSSASESTLMTLLAARSRTIQREMSRDPNQSIHEITNRMVAYASKCSHSCAERAGMIAMVTTRLLDVDENISLRGEVLKKAIEEDRKNGKIPVYVFATIGTTHCCTFDNLAELGPICREENIWLHVDAAFAGTALLCPEFRYIAKGLEDVTSFDCSPYMLMKVNLDCTALWIRNSNDMTNAFNVNPLYLQHEDQHKTIDYRHWQISLGRRFRSIKLWFVMRMFGLEGLRHHIREGVARAKHFEKLVRSDTRFEVLFPVTLALVCLRLVGNLSDQKEINDLNERLHQKIQDAHQFVITPANVNGMYVLRVSTGVSYCTTEETENLWKHMQEKANMVL